jgi:threonine aldolase
MPLTKEKEKEERERERLGETELRKNLVCAVPPTPSLPSAVNFSLASDNTAGVCPEAWKALAEANTGYAPSYGDDRWTARARELFDELFQTRCDVYFVFNGTAANSLALAACCRRPYTRVLCHEISHIDTDECGAPEFFTGGAKLTALRGLRGKLAPGDLEPALHLGHGIHYPKPAAISLTQATEWSTVYTPEEVNALGAFARTNRLAVHMDGARFANAIAALQQRKQPDAVIHSLAASGSLPADVTWRAGVDVLCFGGTKQGMLTSEAVVFFNRELAQEFEYRVKQSGQLASKMRFAAAQWVGMLQDGAWLRHAARSNALARQLAREISAIPGFRVLFETDANSVFVEIPPKVASALSAKGWLFHRFIGEHGYRLMCSWATTQQDIATFLADARAA